MMSWLDDLLLCRSTFSKVEVLKCILLDLSGKQVLLSMILKLVGVLGSDAVSALTEVEILELRALDG